MCFSTARVGVATIWWMKGEGSHGAKGHPGRSTCLRSSGKQAPRSTSIAGAGMLSIISHVRTRLNAHHLRQYVTGGGDVSRQALALPVAQIIFMVVHNLREGLSYATRHRAGDVSMFREGLRIV